LHPEAHLPRRRMRHQALLSPFDSLIWERQRTERLWGFRYRIEIYTPAPTRVYGYYVLPFLLDEHLVARVDLKADRQAGALRAQATWLEDGAPAAPDEIAAALARSLTEMAAWLGLPHGVEVRPRGTLAAHLADALR
ncbi:MAG TPA: crosslink repair DNA glycosylase YcaQ family protein, partial [Acidimicrobiales bacterium]